MPELSAISERAKVTTESKESGWVSRAVDGFLESGKEAIHKPLETSATVAAGLGLGSIVQAGLSGAEHMGGKFGTAAKIGRVALIAAPLAYSAYRIAEADDSVKETGKMAFEMGLFMGASKLGSAAVARSFDARALTYKPVTEVPEGVAIKAFGNKAIVTADRFHEFPLQVRLANGRGFVAKNSGEIELQPMPDKLPGIGRIEYAPGKTTLHTESGSKFEHNLRHETTSTQDALGNKLSTKDGSAFSVKRTNGDSVNFQADGGIRVYQGSFQSGSEWAFKPDGHISMRSLPSGKYRMEITPDGEGISSTARGTSRSIMGRVRGSNHLPIERSETRFTVDKANLPDVTPIEAEMKEALVNAAKLFSQLGRPQAS